MPLKGQTHSPERREQLRAALARGRATAAANRAAAKALEETAAKEPPMAVRTMGSPDQPVAPQFHGEYEGYTIDVIEKQNRERAGRKDARDEFGHADVRVFAGPDRTPFTLKIRYTRGGTFAFAVYNENPEWFDYAEQDWLGAARSGLAKFAAERGLGILEGPRREDLAQYNMMIRTQEAINESA